MLRILTVAVAASSLLACNAPKQETAAAAAQAPAAAGPAAPPSGWNTAPNDERVPGEELRGLVVGKVVTYESGASSAYHADGSYVFSDDGRSWRWSYDIGEDGVVCLRNPNGERRCDLHVRRDGRLVLINERGGVFPVASIEPV